jgi:hypothetical protein
VAGANPQCYQEANAALFFTHEFVDGLTSTRMTPPPIALGLFLCDMVITDQRTRCPTPINIFTGLAVEGFPSDNAKLSIFAALTDAKGHGIIALEVIRLDTGARIYLQQFPIDFPDRQAVVNVNIRVRRLSFPVEGLYDFLLGIDEELIAQRTLRVYQSSGLDQ